MDGRTAGGATREAYPENPSFGPKRGKLRQNGQLLGERGLDIEVKLSSVITTHYIHSFHVLERPELENCVWNTSD